MCDYFDLDTHTDYIIQLINTDNVIYEMNSHTLPPQLQGWLPVGINQCEDETFY